MKLNMKQAADHLGITDKTWRNWRKKKDFPATIEQDDKGDPVVDLSELIRCWPDRVRSEEEIGGKKGQGAGEDSGALAAELRLRDEKLALLENVSRDDKEEIAYLREKLDELMKQETMRMKLLEDQRAKDEAARKAEAALRKKERAAAAKFRERKEALERRVKALESMSLLARIFAWPGKSRDAA